jgi:hypothetical protein
MKPAVFQPDKKSQFDIRGAAGAGDDGRTVQRGPTDFITGRIIRASYALVIGGEGAAMISGFVVECDRYNLAKIADKKLYNKMVTVREERRAPVKGPRAVFERLPADDHSALRGTDFSQKTPYYPEIRSI